MNRITLIARNQYLPYLSGELGVAALRIFKYLYILQSGWWFALYEPSESGDPHLLVELSLRCARFRTDGMPTPPSHTQKILPI